MSIFGSKRKVTSREWAEGTTPSFFELEVYTFLEGFNTKKISVDIEVHKQTDRDGHGPGYVLAGYTDKDYWYEALITYHWRIYSHGSTPYYKDEFSFQMEVWTPQKKEYKVEREHLIGHRPLTIEDGDIVNLSLEIKGDEVISRIQGRETYEHKWPAYGSQSFIGTGTPPNEKGEFMPWREDGLNSWIGIEYYHERQTLGSDPGKTTNFRIREPEVQKMHVVLTEGQEIQTGMGEVDITKSFEDVEEGIMFRGDGQTISIGKL